MATDAEPEDDEVAKWSTWAIAAAVLLALLFGGIVIAGVRGCMTLDPQELAKLEEERKKKEEEDKKKKKDDFDISFPVILPSEPNSPGQYVKPGHWATSTQQMRANYNDLVGESQTFVVDKQGLPYLINQTPFELRTIRPVTLTKGQRKNLENTLFVPMTDQGIYFSSEITERGLGLRIPKPPVQLSRMPSFQYHFVILAKEPSRYTFVKTIDSVAVPYGGETEFEARNDQLHYRVDQLSIQQTIPLSDNPLTWTAIAYIMWDEVDPNLFTPAQQKALVDWLHWGGQLIVNGPDSLDLLKGSFLEEYLPARNAGPRKLEAGDPAFAELNEHWIVSTRRVPGERLKPTAPWSGIKLELVPDAKNTTRALPNTGELLVERQVGRGRIVVSAMQLSERDLINWRSGFESLFNACLLRRPNRVYSDGTGGPVLNWASNDLRERRLDAKLTTRLRFFARDLGVDTSYQFQDVQDEFNQTNQFGQPQTIREYRAPHERGRPRRLERLQRHGQGGPQCATQGRGRRGAQFVVCRSLPGRVPDRARAAELAVFPRAATDRMGLDRRAHHRHRRHLGRRAAGATRHRLRPVAHRNRHPRATARSSAGTPIAVLRTIHVALHDLRPGVPQRDHACRAVPGRENDPMLARMDRVPLNFQRQEAVRLTGLPVSSASTNLVHSEQMFPLDGAIRLGRTKAGGTEQIENLSQFKLQSVAVMKRPDRSENAKNLTWHVDRRVARPVSQSRASHDEANHKCKNPVCRRAEAEERLENRMRLDLEPMFQLALNPANMEEGEIRLVARVDEVLPGQTITPSASQVRAATSSSPTCNTPSSGAHPHDDEHAPRSQSRRRR